MEFVDLSLNQLSGEISSAIGNLTSLQTLYLSENHISGKLPSQIMNLCRIQSLELSANELQGEVPNMSECFLGSLVDLTLSGNQLSGYLTDQFGEFKILETLDLSFNSLSSAIPSSLGKLPYLESLFLNDNKFRGNLPESLGQHSNLGEFRIENNMLEGIVNEIHFANLLELGSFSASGNHLTLNVSQNWVPPFQLTDLRLRSWSLDQIPSWLQTQRYIDHLDLSNTGISGSITDHHWLLDIFFLNVSHNNLHGEIAVINSTKMQGHFLYLSCNKFSGSLPRQGDNVVDLDLSHNLYSEGLYDLLCDTTPTYGTHNLHLLNLEGNRLSGELPDCWEKRPYLTFLKLGNNTMSGRIPNSLGILTGLESLSLYGNKFSGQIPFSMQNCMSLLKIDLSHNNLDGNIPSLMGRNLVKLRILILRSNKFSGEISSEICHLQSLQILDLSNNQFSGTIPRCVSNISAMTTKRALSSLFQSSEFATLRYGDELGSLGLFLDSASVVTKGVELEYGSILSLVTNIDLSKNNLSGEIPKELTSLVGLRSLNLSRNHLTSSIPESNGDMKELESLDFSRNSLSGQIPNGFTLLSSLSHLNLSFNKLRGRIPESTQLQSFDASSFVGNDLCGTPLTTECSPDGEKEEEEVERSEIEWLYVFISLGFAVGFSGACTALVLNKPWRVAYFGFFECMKEIIYVYFYVKWRSLTKPAAPTS